jgi:type II secretory ATPase GspE/PulE/Tfp pilus assembly ATPase PilB-like protein
MNPFVNPNKRSFTLPKGCKDLADVLKRPEYKRDEAIRRFIFLILLQAQQSQATELIIGAPSAGHDVPIKYRVDDVWFELAPVPSHIWEDIVSELVRMANFHAGQIPGEGLLDERLGKIKLLWLVTITSSQKECVFLRVED